MLFRSTVTLVERWPTLGGVCLNVGCIPSKALLHAAKVVDEAAAMADHGITFGPPKIDLDKLRGWKASVVGKLTGGLQMLAKQRKPANCAFRNRVGAVWKAATCCRSSGNAARTDENSAWLIWKCPATPVA